MLALYQLKLEILETLKNLRGKLCWTPKNCPFKLYLNYVNLPYFGTRRSEVFWKIERVPILAGDLAMVASALMCYYYMFLKEKIYIQKCFTTVKFNVFNPRVPSN